MSIVFVNMPMSAIERPSIALGILKAILEKADIPVQTLYPNLWFCEYIGIQFYQMLDRARPQEILGDWVFSKAAFPEKTINQDQYIDYLIKKNPALAQNTQLDIRSKLKYIQDSAAQFIEMTVDRILELQPKIVGCTSMFQQNVASLAVLRRIRERAPHIVTMMGGANCETVMGRAVHQNFPWVDYVVSGEADELIVDLCKGALSKGRDLQAHEVPLGVMAPCHRADGGPTTSSGDGVPRAIVQDMRQVPVPDYSDYFDELSACIYGQHVYPAIPIETSRGCWWGAKSHCTFCGLNGGSMSFRSKPPSQARADIETLLDRHGIRRIQAVDNIMDTAYITDLLPGLAEREQPLSIFFEVKSNLKRGQIELFARSGVRSIQPGIESLDTRVLRLMRKGCAAWQNILLLKWTRQYGVSMAWTTIVGFPNEQDEWHAQTAELVPALHHLQPGGFSWLRYDRYSPYHSRPADWNLTLVAGNAYGMTYPLAAEALNQIAYFMEDVDSAGLSATDRWADKPGLRALALACGAWRQAHKGAPGPGVSPSPTLTMERQADGGALLTDTRQCARAGQDVLSTLEVAILDQADTAPTLAQLAAALVGRASSADALDTAVARLMDARLLLAVDGRVVSLVLDHPLPPPQRPHERPNGFIRLARAQTALEKILVPAAAGAE